MNKTYIYTHTHTREEGPSGKREQTWILDFSPLVDHVGKNQILFGKRHTCRCFFEGPAGHKCNILDGKIYLIYFGGVVCFGEGEWVGDFLQLALTALCNGYPVQIKVLKVCQYSYTAELIYSDHSKLKPLIYQELYLPHPHCFYIHFPPIKSLSGLQKWSLCLLLCSLDKKKLSER